MPLGPGLGLGLGVWWLREQGLVANRCTQLCVFCLNFVWLYVYHMQKMLGRAGYTARIVVEVHVAYL